MVGHEVDDGLEAVAGDAFEQGAEFIEPFSRIRGVVRADIKVIADGVGGSRLALE